MAKVSIKAGEELDVLTQDELRTVLEETLSGYLRTPYRDRVVAGGSTDSSGDMAPVAIYKVRAGFHFVLTRLIVLPAGYTFASPFSPTPQGAVELLRDQDLVDGYPFGANTGGTLPAVLTNNKAQAIEAADGETISAQVAGGPHSTAFLFLGHGFVSPIEPQQ